MLHSRDQVRYTGMHLNDTKSYISIINGLLFIYNCSVFQTGVHWKDIMNSLSAQQRVQNYAQSSLSEEVICFENVFIISNLPWTFSKTFHKKYITAINPVKCCWVEQSRFETQEGAKWILFMTCIVKCTFLMYGNMKLCLIS